MSNSNNFGMATVLQNNKNCMKTLSNGSSVVGVGSAGSNNIVVGNLNAPTITQHTNQVDIATSTCAPTQTLSTSTQGAFGSSNNVATLSGSLMLPPQPQTILLTNGVTGATTILSYQQYQHLLQQQQQQRLLVSQNLVNLPIGSLTSSSGLTVITDSTQNHVSSSGNTPTSQGTLLVATSSSASTIATVSATSSFQQQFQQQLANLQNSQNATTNTPSSLSTITSSSSSYVQQLGVQQLQKPGNAGNNNTTTIRHFSQFSQPQPANTINVLSNTSGNNQQQLRTTTVLINRNKNTIIAGNATQRLQHATILTKAPTNKKSQAQHHQGTIVVNNMAVQQVINNSNGQIISLVKTNQQQPIKDLATKSAQQAMTGILPHQQLKKQNFDTTNVQQIKHQQLKVVSANNQAIPQRATIINSNTITKNKVLSNNNSNSINATKLINLNKSTTTTSPSAPIKSTKSISSNSLTHSQKQTTQQQQQINGHLTNHKLNNLQQPASKLVPNGLNTHKSNTNSSNVKSSLTSMASSSSSISSITSTSSLPNSSTFQNIPTSSKPAITNQNTSLMSTSQRNSQTTHTTPNSITSATMTAGATFIATSSSHIPSNPSSTDTKFDSVASAAPNTSNSNMYAAISTSDNQEPEPEIDIVINNVVCSFSVRCHLNLREIALNGANVEYRRENGMVTMKLRRPYTTASIWSSGRITCTGATSEEQAKIAARRYARCLEKLGFRVRFHNFRVVNVLGTCSMPWAIKIVNFSEKYREEASYEPELHPGVTYKLRYPKATLKIFSTGSITVTAASVAHVQCAIEHIFPLVYEFRKKRSPEELEQLRLKQIQNATLEDITETENVTVSASGSSVSSANRGGNMVPIVSTSQRRRLSSTYSKFPIVKRKRLEDINEEFDADDPSSVIDDADDPSYLIDDADDMVLYDPNESIIECPDNEDEL